MTLVADTSAVFALLDQADSHHAALHRLFTETGDRWVLPWAILPEVDYLAANRLQQGARLHFLDALVSGELQIEWGASVDLRRANQIDRRYSELGLGLVDSTVVAIAERLRAAAIVTLDLRHFGAVEVRGHPKLFPRDYLPGA